MMSKSVKIWIKLCVTERIGCWTSLLWQHVDVMEFQILSTFQHFPVFLPDQINVKFCISSTEKLLQFWIVLNMLCLVQNVTQTNKLHYVPLKGILWESAIVWGALFDTQMTSGALIFRRSIKLHFPRYRLTLCEKWATPCTWSWSLSLNWIAQP